MAKKLRRALLAVIGVGYLCADVWLYALSRLSVWDAVMLDIMLTAGAVLVAVMAWALTGGFSEDDG